MFQPGFQVGVAVSGGADSVCLLHVLYEMRPRWNLALRVLHINHQLRGQESKQDEEFVADLAARLGLPFHVESVNVEALAGQDNLEQAARAVRGGFYRRLLEARLIDRVAVGHTRNDQAETVLFRFLRGSGTAGLAGIRPVTADGVVRPLLNTTRAEIEDWLRGRGFSWREDASNGDFRFARNRIRHELLPQMARDWNPAMMETLAQTADWAQAEEAYWEAEIGRIAAQRLVSRDGAVLTRADSLRELPAAVSRRLVREAIRLVKGDLRGIAFSHIASVLELAQAGEGHGRVQVPGVDVFRSFEWLRLAQPIPNGLETRNFRQPLKAPGVTPVPGTNLSISLELIEKSETSNTGEYVYNDGVDYIDWRRLSGSLEVRNWRPGDQYRPFGSASDEKIKTLFQTARIPLWERRHWPVITDDQGAIVWARRFGPAQRYAADSQSKVILTIQEARTMGSESEGSPVTSK
jgi:tRNA(Ile)-lysidine synthase